MSQREDYFSYARRGLRNRGVADSRENLIKFFGLQAAEERARILTEMPAEDDSDLGIDTQDLESALERRRLVGEMNKVHHALLRNRR